MKEGFFAPGLKISLAKMIGELNPGDGEEDVEAKSRFDKIVKVLQEADLLSV
ncbi:MAG: hypothetical protein NY202_03505 [Mollicutes bacterium UO1]